MRILIMIAVVLATQIFSTTSGNPAPLSHRMQIPLVISGGPQPTTPWVPTATPTITPTPTVTPTSTPLPLQPDPITIRAERVFYEEEPYCDLRFIDGEGWAELCWYRFYAITKTDVAEVSYCSKITDSCEQPDADRIEDGLVYWDVDAVAGPDRHVVRTKMASGETLEFEVQDVCIGECDW